MSFPDFLLLVPDNAILYDFGKINASVDIPSRLSKTHKHIRIFRWQNGTGEIEFSNGDFNQMIHSSEEISDNYPEIVTMITEQKQEALQKIADAQKAEEDFQKTWDFYRSKRDNYLRQLDLPVLRTLENGLIIPKELISFRNTLRNLPRYSPDPLAVDWDSIQSDVTNWQALHKQDLQISKNTSPSC